MSAIPRNEGEAFEDYRQRQLEDHAATEAALRFGKLRHSSHYDGIYVNHEKNARKALKASFSSFRQFKRATRKGGK